MKLSSSHFKEKKKIKKLRRETILSRMRVARKKVKSAFCNLPISVLRIDNHFLVFQNK